MRRSGIVLLAVTLAAGPAGGQSRPTGTAPAKADRQAAGAEKGIPPRLAKIAGESFVKVRYHFKKDLTEKAGQKSWAAWRARVVERFVDERVPLDAAGVAVGPRTVLVYDNGLEDRFLDRIEVETASGQVLPAKREKLWLSAPLETLRVGPGRRLTPLKFVEAGKIGLDTTLWAAGLVRKGARWRLTFSSVSPSTVFDRKWKGNLVFAAPGERPKAPHHDIADTSKMNAVQILADGQGRPVGVVADDLFDAKGALCTWKGADLLAGEALTHSEVIVRRGKLREDMLKCVQEVKVKFRQEARSSGDSLGSYAGREISVYCIAISPSRAVIPKLFSRRLASKIESIQIKYGPGRRADCVFLGTYKDFGATLIELTSGKFPGHVGLAKSDPPRMRPLWVVSVREKNGRTDVDLTLNRLMTRQRGYRNHFHWVPARTLPSGAFLVDLAGKLVGIQMVQRVENEEQRQLADTGDRPGRFTSTRRSRLFTIGEVRAALTTPAVAFDPKIKVLSKRLAKRRQWFGVEYVAMSRELAKQMKLEKQTKDGTIGFLVSAIYDGSPAEKMGVAVGDVLLAMRVEGQPYPVEFKASLVRPARSYGRYRGAEGASGPARRIWKNRANFLTKVLDAIGAGKKVAITYHDADAKGAGAVTGSFVAGQAPEDFDSAPKWKNRGIGLTVKDLTYEVRKALGMPAGAPGVVVARIEPGSPANIARIWANELITHCDSVDISSARKLRDLVAAARKAGKDKVRLTVLRLGKTRFADLMVDAYDPADDEGLAEE